MMYDFLFEFTEESDYEGEQILCEESSLENAWRCLIEDNGFSRSELKFVETLPVEVGEALGLDTY